MKRFVLFFCINIILCFNSCSEYRETNVDFPDIETLNIDCIIPTDYPEILEVYMTDALNINPEKVSEILLVNENRVKDVFPDRTLYIAGDVYLYENGSLKIEEADRDSNLEILSVGDRDLTYQFLNDYDVDMGESTVQYSVLKQELTVMEDCSFDLLKNQEKLIKFSSDTDLDFKKMNEVQTEISEKLTAITDVKLAFRESYARDSTTFNQNLELFNELMKIQKEYTNASFSPFVYDFSEEDEDYIFVMEQVIGEIPVTNKHWADPTDISIRQEVSARYSQNKGLEWLSLANIYRVQKKIREIQVCTPDSAIKAYIDEYKKSLHFSQTSIRNIELCYAAIQTENGFELHPVWMLTTVTMRTDDDFSYPEYKYNAIDAETMRMRLSEKAEQ